MIEKPREQGEIETETERDKGRPTEMEELQPETEPGPQGWSQQTDRQWWGRDKCLCVCVWGVTVLRVFP